MASELVTWPYQANQILPWEFKMEGIQIQTHDEVNHGGSYKKKVI